MSPLSCLRNVFELLNCGLEPDFDGVPLTFANAAPRDPPPAPRRGSGGIDASANSRAAQSHPRAQWAIGLEGT